MTRVICALLLCTLAKNVIAEATEAQDQNSSNDTAILEDAKNFLLIISKLAVKFEKEYQEHPELYLNLTTPAPKEERREETETENPIHKSKVEFFSKLKSLQASSSSNQKTNTGNMTTIFKTECKDYLVSRSKADWKLANSSCAKRNMSLISIESREEAVCLSKVNQIKGFPIDKFSSFWTSGTRVGKREAAFKWTSTGKNFSYAEWLPGQPDNGGPTRLAENCISMILHTFQLVPIVGSTFPLNDAPCSDILYFICEPKRS